MKIEPMAGTGVVIALAGIAFVWITLAHQQHGPTAAGTAPHPMISLEKVQADIHQQSMEIDQSVIGIQKQVDDLNKTVEAREELDLAHGFRLGLENAKQSGEDKRKVFLKAVNEIRVRHHMKAYKTFEDWVEDKHR